jgi:hypothetical protein
MRLLLPNVDSRGLDLAGSFLGSSYVSRLHFLVLIGNLGAGIGCAAMLISPGRRGWFPVRHL